MKRNKSSRIKSNFSEKIINSEISGLNELPHRNLLSYELISKYYYPRGDIPRHRVIIVIIENSISKLSFWRPSKKSWSLYS